MSLNKTQNNKKKKNNNKKIRKVGHKKILILKLKQRTS